jgi:hypothetical protein
MPEDSRAHFPTGDEPTFGRRLSTAVAGPALWVALQLERGRRDSILILRVEGGQRTTTTIDSQGFCHQPAIATLPNGNAVVAWNEARQAGGWAIRCAFLDAATGVVCREETVHAGPAWCLPPAVTVDGRDVWLAWPQREESGQRIHMTRRSSTSWQQTEVVSETDADAFRPSLASANGRVFLAWDCYREGTYSLSVRDIASPGPTTRLSPPASQRWLNPRLLVGPGDAVHATWTVIEDVMDDRGIADHAVSAPVMTLTAFPGAQVAGNEPAAVADMRDGLLATDACPYRGYAGLRRNPQLTMTDDGHLWCCWESRFGSDETSTAGHLLGRSLSHAGVWGEQCILHSGGYAYSVPPHWPTDGLPVAFLHADSAGLDIVQSSVVDDVQPHARTAPPERWQRWQVKDLRLPEREQRSGHDEEMQQVFWADTHCHSEISSDAEGHIDELIHFARDVAGLDAVCIVDNDYYPHKALSSAEWQMAQEFARRCTEEGRFIVLPGWEYTYHRRDLVPSFNHRVVMYPRPGWPLFRRTDPQARCESDLLQQLQKTPAVCYPHHCSYEIIDNRFERSVEVCSSWRVCLEESDFTMGQLRDGHRLGFIGSSDSHRAVPGLGGALTGIIAADLTPEALFAAYRNRQTIATQGHRVNIDFRINHAITGGEITVDSAPQISAYVRAPKPIEFIELIRDGACLRRWEPAGDEEKICCDDDCPPGEYVYFLRVKLVGDPSLNVSSAESYLGPFKRSGRYPHNLARARGPFAWTSPIWVTRR